MGSYDGAEICELVGLYLFQLLSYKYGTENIGLYRDDGLATFKNTTGSKAERIKKYTIETFKDQGLNITSQCNLKVTNFLDVILDLKTGSF